MRAVQAVLAIFARSLDINLTSAVDTRAIPATYSDTQ